MKVYIVKDVYISPSGNHIKTDIWEVFSTLESLLVYFNEHKEYWESKYRSGHANYSDLETFYTSNDDKILHYLLFRNNLGFIIIRNHLKMN